MNYLTNSKKILLSQRKIILENHVYKFLKKLALQNIFRISPIVHCTIKKGFQK